MSDLDEAIAYLALRRLQDAYADIVTRRAWDELTGIMQSDCVVTVDTLDRRLDFAGPVEIGAFIASAIEAFDLFEFVILNALVRVDPEAGVGAGRMYLHELRQDASSGRRSDTYGVYHDRFERDAEGRWWFARRFYRSYARTNPSGSERDMSVFELPVTDLDELLRGN